MFATPLPCRMTRASSFAEVECQPTLSPGLSFTETCRSRKRCSPTSRPQHVSTSRTVDRET